MVTKEIEITQDEITNDFVAHIWIIEGPEGNSKVLYHDYILADKVQETKRVVELSMKGKSVMTIMRHEYDKIELNF